MQLRHIHLSSPALLPLSVLCSQYCSQTVVCSLPDVCRSLLHYCVCFFFHEYLIPSLTIATEAVVLLCFAWLNMPFCPSLHSSVRTWCNVKQRAGFGELCHSVWPCFTPSVCVCVCVPACLSVRSIWDCVSTLLMCLNLYVLTVGFVTSVRVVCWFECGPLQARLCWRLLFLSFHW